MKLTPIDIEQQRFARAWRGYDAAEVHQFMEMVAAQTAQLNAEVGQLRDGLAAAERQIAELRAREEGLRAAMLTAQRAIDEQRDNAQREARLIESEAELRADKVMHSAYHKVTRLQEEIHDLQLLRVRVLEELRGVVNTHARLLDVHATEVPDYGAAPERTVLERLRAPLPPAQPDASLT